MAHQNITGSRPSAMAVSFFTKRRFLVFPVWLSSATPIYCRPTSAKCATPRSINELCFRASGLSLRARPTAAGHKRGRPSPASIARHSLLDAIFFRGMILFPRWTQLPNPDSRHVPLAPPNPLCMSPHEYALHSCAKEKISQLPAGSLGSEHRKPATRSLP